MMTRALSVALAFLIQLVPLSRSAVVSALSLVPVGRAVVLRLLVGTATLLGGYHAVSGATAIAGSRTVDGTVGMPLSRGLATSGQTAHSWSAETAPRGSAVYPLTPGLFLTNRTGRIGGVPTEAATASISITAWENGGNSGAHISAVFTIRIVDSVAVPVITQEQLSRAAIAGQDLVFTVTATGAAPMSYFWRKDSTVIRTTSQGILPLPGAQIADAGIYSVIVSNALGTTASAEFALTVNPDVTHPILAITSPGIAALTITSNTIRLTGTARDDVTISNVSILPPAGGLILATGTTNWSAVVPLEPGTNRLRVKALDRSGNSTEGLRTVVFVVTSPLGLSIEGDGSVTGATNGQPLVVGRGYALTATPRTGSLFSNWIGGMVSSTHVLRFIMHSNFTLTAQFVPNPFLAVAGGYQGLFFEAPNPRHGSAGYITAAVLPSGAFSASLLNGLRKYPLAGRFDLDGRAIQRVARPGTNALSVELQLDLHDANVITGRVTDGSWSSILTAHRAVFQAVGHPAFAFATNYTWLMPGSGDAPLAPPGDSFGSLKVDRGGVATLAGTLADANPVAQKAPLSGAGDWPLYVSLPGGRGSIFGWWRARPTADLDLDGTVNWTRLPGPSPKVYTDGFALSSVIAGSIYSQPGTNRILNLDRASVRFTDGDLAEPFANALALGPSGRVTNMTANKLTLTLNPLTGWFAGNVTPPGASRAIPFKGALLQRQLLGGGSFPGTNQTGRVALGP